MNPTKILFPIKTKKSEETTLYRHYDVDNNLLYVGISLSWQKRLKEHKVSSWYKKISNVTLEHHESREKAMYYEREAIKKEKPLYNIQNNNTLKEVNKASKEILDKSQNRFMGNFVNFKLSYSLNELKSMSGLSMKQIELYTKKNILSYYEVTYRDGCTPKKRFTGWDIINLLEYLTKKDKIIL